MRTFVPGKQTPRSAGVLSELAQRIREIEAGGALSDRERAGRAVGTGWETADRALGGAGLACGAVHEWFGLVETGSDHKQSGGGRGQVRKHSRGRGQFRGRGHLRRWMPPLCILTHLARRCLVLDPGKWSVWISRRVWPYPHVLTRWEGMCSTKIKLKPLSPILIGERGKRVPDPRHQPLNRCLFVDPPDDATRLWTIDLALRSEAVCVVIADGNGLDMAATRRLQLAAESAGTLGLLARPPAEQLELSAAATRWRVSVEPSRNQNPRWRAQLVRGRRSHEGTEARRHEGKKGSDEATKRRSDEGGENDLSLSTARPPPLAPPRSSLLAPPNAFPVCLLELSRETGMVRDVTDEPDPKASGKEAARRQTA